MHWFSNCVLANLHNEQIVWFQMSLRKEWKEQGEENGSIGIQQLHMCQSCVKKEKTHCHWCMIAAVFAVCVHDFFEISWKRE